MLSELVIVSGLFRGAKNIVVLKINYIIYNKVKYILKVKIPLKFTLPCLIQFPDGRTFI